MTDSTHMTNDMVTAALLEAYGQAGGNDPAVVLLVDDEMGILKALRRVLRRDGHEVVLANGGREGIEVLENREVHLIICDQRMPDVPGHEVLARAFELQPDAFRITLTGHTDLAAAQRSINEGHVNQFLMKPWDDDQIRQVVDEGLRAYRLILENRSLAEVARKQHAELEQWNQSLEAQVAQRTEEVKARNLQIRQANEDVERMLRDFVGLTASLLETMSPSLGLHSRRVSQIAKRLGTWLNVGPTELRDLELAGYLHDLGKIAKAKGQSEKGEGPAQMGFRMLSQVAGFERIALGIRHQADRYDGVGNPGGMSGESIPLIARVLAVAEAYDRAVFTHPDDPTQMVPAAGRQVLSAESGKSLDPTVAAALLKHLSPATKKGAPRAKSTEPQCEEAPEFEIVEVRARDTREGMVLDEDLVNEKGILIVSGGTRLTQTMVKRIRAMGRSELLMKTLRVRVVPPKADAQATAAA